MDSIFVLVIVQIVFVWIVMIGIAIERELSDRKFLKASWPGNPTNRKPQAPQEPSAHTSTADQEQAPLWKTLTPEEIRQLR